MEKLKFLKRIILVLFIAIVILSQTTVYALSLSTSITLQKGSTGSNVKTLQSMLNQVLGCNLSVDGDFGNATRTQVINFQKQNGLSADGIVGPKTIKKLNELCGTSTNNTTPTPTPQPSGSGLPTGITLKVGSKGTNVSTLQSMLNKILGCGLVVDGDFGNATRTQVINFQRMNGLSDDGIVGPQTIAKLNSVYSNGTYLPTTSEESSTSVSKILVIASTINLRKGAGTNYSKIDSVNYGDIYEVLDTKSVSGTPWYKIRKSNGTTGYIIGSSSYVAKTFVIVDTPHQSLGLYKNGQRVLFSNVVTGTKNKHDTPKGVYTFKVSNKEYNTSLKGYNPDKQSYYDSPVTYWMPFITEKGIGFHDASWRSSFGGDIYTYNGSLGCVNMPTDKAKSLWNAITSDIWVVVI